MLHVDWPLDESAIINTILHRDERTTYYKHREKARNDPSKYLTIIIDGMDQAKTNVPQPVQESKTTQNLWRLKTHITGA